MKNSDASIQKLLGKLGPLDLILLWITIIIAPIFITICFLIGFSYISLNGYNAFLQKVAQSSFGFWGSLASVLSFLVGAGILFFSYKIQNQSDKLSQYLFRSWPGSQTDYGANLSNTHTQKTTEIERHIEDIEKGFTLNDGNSLEEAGFLLSSIAYGIEHKNPAVLTRFIDVLHRVVSHPQLAVVNPKRIIRIGIWPIEEHQIIWGANRQNIVNCPKISKQPVLRNLTEDSTWKSSRPSWTTSYSRFKAVVKQLKRIGQLLEAVRKQETEIHFELDEIEPWSVRGFYNKSGRDNTYSLLIATTPINSQTLNASHWTTTGFHSHSFDSYKQLSKILDTCVKTRYSFSDGTSSKANKDIPGEENTDKIVHLAAKFLNDPYDTLSDYFLLDKGWENWKEAETKAFYASILKFSQDNSRATT